MVFLLCTEARSVSVLSSCDQGEGANSDMNSHQEICSVDGAAGGAAWGRDPIDSLELDEASPYQVALVFSLRILRSFVCLGLSSSPT